MRAHRPTDGPLWWPEDQPRECASTPSGPVDWCAAQVTGAGFEPPEVGQDQLLSGLPELWVLRRGGGAVSDEAGDECEHRWVFDLLG